MVVYQLLHISEIVDSFIEVRYRDGEVDARNAGLAHCGERVRSGVRFNVAQRSTQGVDDDCLRIESVDRRWLAGEGSSAERGKIATADACNRDTLNSRRSMTPPNRPSR